jgi:hemoglobin
MSLFEKYGGITTVQNLVRDFYQDVIVSPTLSPYFKNTDLEVLIGHQVDLFCFVMGGPCSFDLDRLRTAHMGLKINAELFAEAATLLQNTLEDHQVEADDIRQVMETVASTAVLIVQQ